MDLGSILKYAREVADKKQKDVAQILGLSPKTISGYENNVSEPDFQTMMKLFRLYDVSVDKLLGLSGKEPFTETELKLLSLFHKLSEEEQKAWITLLEPGGKKREKETE